MTRFGVTRRCVGSAPVFNPRGACLKQLWPDALCRLRRWRPLCEQLLNKCGKLLTGVGASEDARVVEHEQGGQCDNSGVDDDVAVGAGGLKVLRPRHLRLFRGLTRPGRVAIEAYANDVQSARAILVVEFDEFGKLLHRR